jgi:hypothetical protein
LGEGYSDKSQYMQDILKDLFPVRNLHDIREANTTVSTSKARRTMTEFLQMATSGIPGETQETTSL